MKSWLKDDLELGGAWWVPIALFPIAVFLGVSFLVSKVLIGLQKAEYVEKQIEDISEREGRLKENLDAIEREEQLTKRLIESEEQAEIERVAVEHEGRMREIRDEAEEEFKRLSRDRDALDRAVDDLLD